MASSRVKVPIYGRIVVMVDDEDEAKDLRHKYRTADQNEQASEDSETHGYGNCAICGCHRRVVVMFINRAKKHPGGILATVVHESVHAAGMVLEIAGVSYGPNDDEQLAYLTDWLYSQWCRKMEQYNGK